jgi:hypothetical protein
MNTSSDTTYNQPSEMMHIDSPSVPTHQLEDAPKTPQEVAYNLVDSVMGTQDPDGAADTSSASQVQDSLPGPHKRVEPESIQGIDMMDTEYLEVTDIPPIQELFASYAKSFPAPSKIGKST